MKNDQGVPKLDSQFQEALDRALEFLKLNLKENAHSIILYGSAVRGNLSTKSSDLNLLIVLEESTAAAHRAISQIVQANPLIEPFIVERGGMHRATRVFALKFLSIRRNYRVLHGADPLRELEVPPDLQLLLAEQELRNLRMRLVHAFVVSGEKHERYRRFLINNAARFFIVLSDVLYCADVELPKDFDSRLPIFEQHFGTPMGALKPLLELKHGPEKLTPQGASALHGDLVMLLKHALQWMEKRWPQLPL